MAFLAARRMQGLDAQGEGPRVIVESEASPPRSTERSVERAIGHAAAPGAPLPQSPPERHVKTWRIPWTMLARLGTGLTLGLLLGFLGLPRIELPGRGLSSAPTPVVSAVLDPREQPDPAPPTTVIPPTSTRVIPPTQAVPTPNARPTAPGVLFAERFVSPLPDWPNDARGTAWFANGEYRLMARESGRFVATRVPLAQPVADAKLSAQFHKVGGPAGGGYGLIIRDQSLASERDGRNQAGRYLVVEVGDRGDIGVWQRDQTRWIDIVPWSHSDAVHTDTDSNAMSVTTRGNALTFEVNGSVVADVDYPRLPGMGGVGIFVGGDLNEVALEWLRIDTLD